MPKLKERPVADEQTTATYTLKEVVEMMNARFDRFENKFDKLENKFDKLENKMDKLENKMDKQFDRLENKMDSNFKWALSLILGSWLTIMLTLLLR